MKEIGQTYMYFNFIFGGQIWYENSCLDFSLHAVLNWWAWQFRHVHVHVYLHLAFFQKNSKCIGMILIISTHCNKNIYKILSTNFVKNIFLNGFIMGIGKRSLQDFYTLPLGCVCTRMTQRPASLFRSLLIGWGKYHISKHRGWACLHLPCDFSACYKYFMFSLFLKEVRALGKSS